MKTISDNRVIMLLNFTKYSTWPDNISFVAKSLEASTVALFMKNDHICWCWLSLYIWISWDAVWWWGSSFRNFRKKLWEWLNILLVPININRNRCHRKPPIPDSIEFWNWRKKNTKDFFTQLVFYMTKYISTPALVSPNIKKNRY